MKVSQRISDEMAEVILKISSLLMTSGANTNRILTIINKYAALINADAQVFINHKAFIISLKDLETGERSTMLKRLPNHSVNFAVISALSADSLKAEKEHWDLDKIEKSVDKIEKIAHHPRLLTLFSVSFAGAALAILFGGSYISFMAVFLGTFLGLFTKIFSHKKGFNIYLSSFFGCLISSFVAGSFMRFFPDINPDIAIATSVLFSIPGVPLLNAFTDFMDGYFITGLVRFINGFLIVISIAAALFITMYWFNIQQL